MTAVSPSVDVFRVHSPAARAPANASTVAVTVVVGTVLTIKFTNWPVKLNGMGSGLKPAAFRVPLGLGVNSSSRVTEELRGGTQQALLASTSKWRRVGLGERVVPTSEAFWATHTRPPKELPTQSGVGKTCLQLISPNWIVKVEPVWVERLPLASSNLITQLPFAGKPLNATVPAVRSVPERNGATFTSVSLGLVMLMKDTLFAS
jgi:hypothetical protein